MPFTVQREDGRWLRRFEPTYEEGSECVWRFFVTTASGRRAVIESLGGPLSKDVSLFAFGEPACSRDGNTGWRACAGLAVGGSAGPVAVRTVQRFDGCERMMEGVGIGVRLSYELVLDGKAFTRAAHLPWPAALHVTSPPDARCEARMPLPVVTGRLARWIHAELDEGTRSGMRVGASDVRFLDDVADTGFPDRLATFRLNRPRRLCAGLVHYRREPKGWRYEPAGRDIPLSDVLLAHAIRCLPIEDVARRGGIGLRVAMPREDGLVRDLAVGFTVVPDATHAIVVDPSGHERMFAVNDGAFAVRDPDGALAGIEPWQIDLAPTPSYGYLRVGRFPAPRVELVPAAADTDAGIRVEPRPYGLRRAPDNS